MQGAVKNKIHITEEEMFLAQANLVVYVTHYSLGWSHELHPIN